MSLHTLFSSLFLIVILTSANAKASVTLLGSRIIYPSSAHSIDIQFKNDDNIPYVIQSWFDEGDIDAQPQQVNNVSFIITPPVFRIQPKAGQVSRIMFNQTTALPQDRETLYWFNMLQIPPSNLTSDSAKNSMTVMLRNRVKIFYRPTAIGEPKNILKGLTVHDVYDAVKGNGITIDNAQPWYASIVAVSVRISTEKYSCTPEMIAPFARQTCWFHKNNKRLQGVGAVNIDAINDQGARISESYTIDAQ
ncbi:fimbria/pilus periplasmic chaperone [Pantoea sp. NPDC088449]|uniref:fimbria/pilus periplasmic chaperone n=1 Tax=Pantoea sp. NPDC088449 TaxID=3364392 RepID=UPI00380A31EC